MREAIRDLQKREKEEREEVARQAKEKAMDK